MCVVDWCWGCIRILLPRVVGYIMWSLQSLSQSRCLLLVHCCYAELTEEWLPEETIHSRKRQFFFVQKGKRRRKLPGRNGNHLRTHTHTHHTTQGAHTAHAHMMHTHTRIIDITDICCSDACLQTLRYIYCVHL